MDEYGGIGGIINVASGRESVKIDIGLVPEDILYISIAMILAIALGYLFGNILIKAL
jgi:hypothetical protein